MGDAFRLRVCHRKAGRLRYLSHLELARACERGVRRAGLPYAVTQGFTPRMRIAFGPALPVGTAGEREYFDVWLVRFVRPDEALERLRRAVVDEIAPVRVAYVGLREPSLSAALAIASYEVEVEGGIREEELRQALDCVSRQPTLEVEHKGRTKVFDLAEALPKRPEVRLDGERLSAVVTVRIGEQGSLRPEVLVSAALGRDAAVAVTRVGLFVDDGEAWRDPL